MTYEQWLKSLSTEQRYYFNSDGRAYKKDATLMMRMAWDAAASFEREACAKACEELRANRPTTERGLLIATECAVVIRERSNVQHKRLAGGKSA